MITLAKYNELISKLNDLVGQYERMNYQTNRHTLNLANGDVVNIKFFKNNLAHLLGVKLDYLKQANKFKDNMNSYECLKYFLDNDFIFSKLVTESKQLNFDSMFSKYIDEKLSAFINNIKIRTDDLEFVIKYDSEKTYQIEEDADICDYYIVRRINGSYHILGLIKSDTNDIYLPVTSRKYDDFYEYDKFMNKIAKKQEITYPYTMQIRNNDKDFKQNLYLRLEDKQILLDKIIKTANRYDATVSVARDFSYVMNSSITSKTKQRDEISILQLLSDSIKGKTILDNTTIFNICGQIELSDEMNELINLYNNLIVSNSISDDAKDCFSEVVNERDTAIKELDELKKQLNESNDNFKSLQEENKILKEENNSYETKMNILEEAFQKIKSI